MTKYILHGGMTRYANELNRTFFEEIVRDVPDGGTVLVCYFASTDDDTERREAHTAMLKAAAPGKSLNIVFATKEVFIEQLRGADALFINGGDTQLLIDTLRGYPEFPKLLEGKTVAGSSAGAYALVRYGTTHRAPKMYEGFGLLPLRVICHDQSPELPPNPESERMVRAAAPELELVLLKDCEWKVFNA